MAANTNINFALQARDWEALVGIISYNPMPEFQEVLFSLQTQVRAASPKPSGTTVITVSTTEYFVTKISEFLYGNTVKNIIRDTGANSFTRIMTAVRAANNAADNYISTTLAALDASYAATADQIRKNGRQVVMMSTYDNT